jgi:hypothetical protein
MDTDAIGRRDAGSAVAPLDAGDYVKKRVLPHAPRQSRLGKPVTVLMFL